MDDEKKLATFDSVNKFSFAGIQQDVKVVRVLDGSTCYIVVDYDQQLIKLKCRLKDIECAEMKHGSLDMKGRDGCSARDFLTHLCIASNPEDFVENQARGDKAELERKLNENRTLIYAELGEFDGYGRVLVELKKEKSSKKNFGEILKEYGYAKDQREKMRSFRN